MTNRFLGWFVLLAYGATGALIVRAGQKRAFAILLTFAGATAAVAGIEVSLVMLTGLGFQAPPWFWGMLRVSRSITTFLRSSF